MVPVNQREWVKLCWCDGGCRCIWAAALGVGTRWSLRSLPTQTTLGWWPRWAAMALAKLRKGRAFLELVLQAGLSYWPVPRRLVNDLPGLWPVLNGLFPPTLECLLWCRNGILQFSTPTKKQSKTTSPHPAVGDKRQRFWVEIRSICWNQQWDKKRNSNCKNANNKNVQRQGDLHAKLLTEELDLTQLCVTAASGATPRLLCLPPLLPTGNPGSVRESKSVPSLHLWPWCKMVSSNTMAWPCPHSSSLSPFTVTAKY